MKYRAHINVEVCATVGAIKYILKYMFKGFDCARLKFERVHGVTKVTLDQIDAFLTGRWVGSCEAITGILSEDGKPFQSLNIKFIDVDSYVQ